MSHSESFFGVLRGVLRRPDVCVAVDRIAAELVAVRGRGGRVFCLGVGGGAANAAHAVNDLRKLCAIEAYAPTDGIAELTARANDEGWDTIFSGWLETSRIGRRDALLIFSVGGGTPEVSACIDRAVRRASRAGACVLGIVGRPDGTAATLGHAVVVADPTGRELGHLLTPVTEALQVAALHALVSDPRLKTGETKW